MPSPRLHPPHSCGNLRTRVLDATGLVSLGGVATLPVDAAPLEADSGSTLATAARVCTALSTHGHVGVCVVQAGKGKPVKLTACALAQSDICVAGQQGAEPEPLVGFFPLEPLRAVPYSGVVESPDTAAQRSAEDDACERALQQLSGSSALVTPALQAALRTRAMARTRFKKHGVQQFIQPAEVGGVGVVLNHSCKPTGKMDTVLVAPRGCSEPRVLGMVKPLRDQNLPEGITPRPAREGDGHQGSSPAFLHSWHVGALGSSENGLGDPAKSAGAARWSCPWPGRWRRQWAASEVWFLTACVTAHPTFPTFASLYLIAFARTRSRMRQQPFDFGSRTCSSSCTACSRSAAGRRCRCMQRLWE